LKYIYYIIAMLLIISALIGYALMPARTPEKKAALIINGKTVTTDEFSGLISSQSGHPLDRENFINSLITRELLIQESQKEGIDKEETFRRAIQNFYEQSLIKLLMDRKFSLLQVSVSDDELNNYISFLNRKMQLTIFSFGSPEEAKGSNFAGGEHKTLYIEDLSRDLRAPVAALKVGEHTVPIKTGGSYVVVRLDRMEKPSEHTAVPDKDSLRKMLTEEKREKMINDWIADLRKKATVKILINE
jgi:parvulin-like peptidyl-prolyl isomerase